MKSKPEVVEMDLEDLEVKLKRIEEAMGEEIARPFAYYWDGTYRC